MKEIHTQNIIVYKNDKMNIISTKKVKENILSIHIGPNEGLSLQLNNKQIGHAFELGPIDLIFNPSADAPDDYERLILSALMGDKTNFVHWDELAESWKYIDSIREAWSK